MTTIQLPAITKTMRPTFRRMSDPTGATRQECWAADTTDGVWHFGRIEDAGTPWIIIHNPTKTELKMYFGSLLSCRKAVAKGWAEKMLEDA